MRSGLTSDFLDLARAVREEIGNSELRSCVHRARRPNGYAHLDQLYVRRDAGRWARLRVRHIAAGVGSHSQCHFLHLAISCALAKGNGAHIWAERYDRQLDDIFALQDEISDKVVGAIEPNLRNAEIDRVQRRRPDSLEAYDLVLRAQPFAYSHLAKDAAIAIPLLAKALEIDPIMRLLMHRSHFAIIAASAEPA